MTESESRAYLESVWETWMQFPNGKTCVGTDPQVREFPTIEEAVAYTQKVMSEIVGIENRIKWLDSMVAGAKDCSWQGHMNRAKEALAEMRVGMKEGK